MNLKEHPFLFLDCQTTGMRPTNGYLLELAWAIGGEEGVSRLVALPEGETVPDRVTEITGIGAEEMSVAKPLTEVFEEFQATVSTASPAAAVIHYAQFEKPFLSEFYRVGAGSEPPFQIVCSHQLAKRLFPNLPSQNIRAVAGFFGRASGPLKRAAAHVEATRWIWKSLVSELERHGVFDWDQLHEWLKTAPKAKRTNYQYRLDRLKRLALPDKPGVYRMLAKSGDILYVGKATSLRSRVNSYFRGQKGKQKKEMLAQVWDLRVSECETPLEAALLESDEIKRHNPPYNVVLKRGRRHLVFYDREFTSAASEQTEFHVVGPFRNSNWIEHLRLVDLSLRAGAFEQIFFNPIPPEDLKAGFDIFCSLNGLEPQDFKNVRSLLAKGLWILKNYVEPEETDSEPTTEADPDSDETADLPPTPEEIAGKFERLLRRAAEEYRRSKLMTKLLDADVVLRLDGGERRLSFRGGSLGAKNRIARSRPWQDLEIADFDRMSILLSELNKYDYEIQA